MRFLCNCSGSCGFLRFPLSSLYVTIGSSGSTAVRIRDGLPLPCPLLRNIYVNSDMWANPGDFMHLYIYININIYTYIYIYMYM